MKTNKYKKFLSKKRVEFFGEWAETELIRTANHFFAEGVLFERKQKKYMSEELWNALGNEFGYKFVKKKGDKP